jgi:hypothetical protein
MVLQLATAVDTVTTASHDAAVDVQVQVCAPALGPVFPHAHLNAALLLLLLPMQLLNVASQPRYRVMLR